jgi:hypothetical protein
MEVCKLLLDRGAIANKETKVRNTLHKVDI